MWSLVVQHHTKLLLRQKDDRKFDQLSIRQLFEPLPGSIKRHSLVDVEDS